MLISSFQSKFINKEKDYKTIVDKWKTVTYLDSLEQSKVFKS